MDSQSPSAGTHELHCLEVWGGSSRADHIASVPGLDISVCARPVGQSAAGGDLYLISSCSSGWISRMLLADVAGHGDGVSDLSAKLRKAMHKSINVVDQSKLARHLNEAFSNISGGSKFATALLMTYYAPAGHLIIVNAGHPPPLLCRDGSRQWAPIDLDTQGVLRQPSRELRIGIKNLPLGVIDSTQYEQFAIRIHDGDRVCAYTDGFIEAQTPDGQLLGVDGFANILSELIESESRKNQSDFSTQALNAIEARGFKLADDDHTMLTFVHNGQGTPKANLSTVTNLIKNSFGFGHIDSVV